MVLNLALGLAALSRLKVEVIHSEAAAVRGNFGSVPAAATRACREQIDQTCLLASSRAEPAL